jgi:hypothetical protein
MNQKIEFVQSHFDFDLTIYFCYERQNTKLAPNGLYFIKTINTFLKIFSSYIISYFTIQKDLEPIDHFTFVLTALSFIDHCAIEALILIS